MFILFFLSGHAFSVQNICPKGYSLKISILHIYLIFKSCYFFVLSNVWKRYWKIGVKDRMCRKRCFNYVFNFNFKSNVARNLKYISPYIKNNILQSLQEYQKNLNIFGLITELLTCLFFKRFYSKN